MRIDELTRALNDRAESVRDVGVPDRLRSLRRRVGVARRRRVAVLAAAAVAAVALVGVPVATGLIDREPGPAEAPHRLAGHVVPERQVANGFAYAYAEGVAGDPGENPLVLRLTVGDTPRLVAFASSASGSTLLARSESGRMGAPSGSFSTYLYLPPGAGRQTVTVRQSAGLGEGRLALAVYDLVDRPPAGVTGSGRTFRADVPGWALVDGAIGAPGRTQLSFTTTLPEGPLRWDETCRAVGPDVMLYYTVEGMDGTLGTSCTGNDRRRDPDATDGSTVDATASEVPRGVPVRVRAWLGDARRGAESPVPGSAAVDAVIGVAVYASTEPQVQVQGTTAPAVFEAQGHRWAVASVDRLAGAGRTFRLTLPADPRARMVQAVVATDPTTGTDVSVSVAGGDADDLRMVPGSGAAAVLGPYLVLPGAERTVTVRYAGALPPTPRVSLLVSSLDE